MGSSPCSTSLPAPWQMGVRSHHHDAEHRFPGRHDGQIFARAGVPELDTWAGEPDAAGAVDDKDDCLAVVVAGAAEGVVEDAVAALVNAQVAELHLRRELILFSKLTSAAREVCAPCFSANVRACFT